jgi:hypothetical protein
MEIENAETALQMCPQSGDLDLKCGSESVETVKW